MKMYNPLTRINLRRLKAHYQSFFCTWPYKTIMIGPLFRGVTSESFETKEIVEIFAQYESKSSWNNRWMKMCTEGF